MKRSFESSDSEDTPDRQLQNDTSRRWGFGSLWNGLRNIVRPQNDGDVGHSTASVSQTTTATNDDNRNSISNSNTVRNVSSAGGVVLKSEMTTHVTETSISSIKRPTPGLFGNTTIASRPVKRSSSISTSDVSCRSTVFGSASGTPILDRGTPQSRTPLMRRFRRDRLLCSSC